MSAVATIHGVIRQTNLLRKKATGEVFGTEVAVLTDAHGVLGDTVMVTVWNPREGDAPLPLFSEGSVIDWVVDFGVDRSYLRVTFRKDANEVVGWDAAGVKHDLADSKK